MSQSQLVDRILVNKPEADKAILNKAYIFGTKMHGRQLRASGDPYFSHPIEVAGILSDLKLDTTSVVCALLHDTIEDTNATIQDIEENFGREVAKLVDGVTKLTLLEGKPGSTKQAENFRKMILTISNDIRVILIKIADRLDNMRTLQYLNEIKQAKIASETLYLYAPLAHRLGLYSIKTELEDLSLKFTHNDEYTLISKKLNETKDNRQKYINQFRKIIKSHFKRYKLSY